MGAVGLGLSKSFWQGSLCFVVVSLIPLPDWQIIKLVE